MTTTWRHVLIGAIRLLCVLALGVPAGACGRSSLEGDLVIMTDASAVSQATGASSSNASADGAVCLPTGSSSSCTVREPTPDATPADARSTADATSAGDATSTADAAPTRDGNPVDGTVGQEDSSLPLDAVADSPIVLTQPDGAVCPLGDTTVCNSVCVDTFTDPAHCGGCGNVCPAGDVCLDGACALSCDSDAGLTLVNCDGACVDLLTNPNHCGSCAIACTGGQQCEGGGCACTGGTLPSLCEGQCVDLASSPTNCGACGTACGQQQVCSGAVCVVSCPDAGGVTNCGGACVDTAEDNANCGACGTVCGGGSACVDGACACPAEASR